jgi:hypothetical protein
MMFVALACRRRELIPTHQKLQLIHVYHNPEPENRDEVSQKCRVQAQVDH